MDNVPLGKKLADARDAAFGDGYDYGHRDGYDKGFEEGVLCGNGPDDLDLARIRSLRLEELLEAEAAERVEVEDTEDSLGINGFRVLPFYPNKLDGEIFVDQFSDSETCFEISECDGRYTSEEVEHLILCLAAALAEKRKRESEVGDE